METDNVIPTITNSLGSGWNQPSRKNILIDDKNALMEKADCDKLLEYNGTYPSAAYEGKMFKRGNYLVWLSAHPTNENLLSYNYREIILV